MAAGSEARGLATRLPPASLVVPSHSYQLLLLHNHHIDLPACFLLLVIFAHEGPAQFLFSPAGQ